MEMVNADKRVAVYNIRLKTKPSFVLSPTLHHCSRCYIFRVLKLVLLIVTVTRADKLDLVLSLYFLLEITIPLEQGTTSKADYTNYLDPGILSDLPIFNVQPRCTPDTTTFSFPFRQSPLEFHKEVRCVEGLNLWRNNSIEISNEIFKGYRQGNLEEIINEVAAAYDLMDTDINNFNVTIWYNSTYKGDLRDRRVKYVRVPRSVNLVSNAYLEFLQGSGTKMLFDFVKEMPKQETRLRLEMASLIGPIFFTWVILLLFPFLLEGLSFPRSWIYIMELYPGFSLYRGLYEFSQYAFKRNLNGSGGMKWKDFNDSAMEEIFYIIIVEWFVALIAAYYTDKISSSGIDPFFFLKNQNPFKKSPSPYGLQRQVSAIAIEMEKLDVAHEMTGLMKPTSGAAFVHGLDICKDMDIVYTSIDIVVHHSLIVCTIYTSLLWETLTGREHLLFYGRLKNLKGSDLDQAVEESLKSVNLFRGGVADKPAGKYSGGMKRRLSVAISLIGSPKVVYMDEPSTGLDPASRRSLWTAIKRAKNHTAIILTTHSMEEAEFLCDRLGIFVDGRLQCVGNPKELKARYGGSYVLTMTTPSEHEKDVEMLVQDVSPNAKKIYHIAGTQKFEIPKEEVRISEVFQAVEKAKDNFRVFAWGLADTTLEDVFIKVARTAQASNVFS
ncbi:ABC transporter-like protein [Arabidopsis thaliana]|nr:ABC transporter-like protein [Arabidopsis thaliana]